MKYKVGDRIRIVNIKHFQKPELLGKVLTIHEIQPSLDAYVCEHNYMWTEDEVERVDLLSEIAIEKLKEIADVIFDDSVTLQDRYNRIMLILDENTLDQLNTPSK